MLEKLFGRKSTGVINIVCLSLILLAMADYAVMFMLGYIASPIHLIGYAFYCVTALAVLLAPRLLQKKFKLYVPVFIEVLLSVYVVVFLLTDIFYQVRTGIFERFLPALGGGIIAMTVFSVLYSALSYSADKRGAQLSAAFVTLITFVTSVLTIAVWHLTEYLVALLIFKHDASAIKAFIAVESFYHAGVAAFCIVAYIRLKLDSAQSYRIKSFRNTAAAKRRALDTGDKGFYKVISNDEKDKTDYRRVFLSAKSKFLLGKVIYLALNAGYLVFLVTTYYRERLLNLALIISLVAAFGVSLLVSVHEYMLFRKRQVAGRLYKLKILRSGLRIMSLVLTFAMLLQADLVYNELNVATSIVMLAVNLITLVGNLRKDNRLAAIESYGKDGLKAGRRGNSIEAAEDASAPPDKSDIAFPEI